MRHTVIYSKPGQVEGARLFDIAADAPRDAVERAARVVAGKDATIKEIVPHAQVPR